MGTFRPTVVCNQSDSNQFDMNSGTTNAFDDILESQTNNSLSDEINQNSSSSISRQLFPSNIIENSHHPENKLDDLDLFSIGYAKNLENENFGSELNNFLQQDDEYATEDEMDKMLTDLLSSVCDPPPNTHYGTFYSLFLLFLS